MTIDINAIRKDFPTLHQQVHGHDLIYFDNAASAQKPQAVMDATMHFYEKDNANVHRGLHTLSMRATDSYEAARETVKNFINAASIRECIFVRGTTEAINLVAQSYVRPQLQAGDEIIITQMEHHSNIVPWQMICEKTGAKLKVAPISIKGELLLDEFAALLNPRTKFVALNYASNAIGTINPVKKIIEMAHSYGAKVLIDGAQSTVHFPVDVQDLGCDFYAFSGHKLYAPTGIGVLWGREDLLESMEPYQGGGEMIKFVTFEKTEYADIPAKFEAGTPNVAGAIGLAAAINYLNQVGMPEIVAYENHLLHYATEAITALEDYIIIGNASEKVPVLSFVHKNIHAHDIGTILDTEGVAIRTGHHCAMPLMDFYKVPATSRISLAFYNTKEEIDRCMNALIKVHEVFG